MNKIFIVLLGLAITACGTTGGTGSGKVRGTSRPVAFTWQSEDSNSGDITATFANGRTFKGKYFEITRDTRVDRLDPLWEGWGAPYSTSAWSYWDKDSNREFVKMYRGRVLANLLSEDGDRMRCRFTLKNPNSGMAGGGKGRCQLAQSKTEINAEFPRA